MFKILFQAECFGLNLLNYASPCLLILPQFVCMCAQLCPTLCNPMNCNLRGSSVHGILQTKILEWVAISSSRRSSQTRNQTCNCCVPYIVGKKLPLFTLLSDCFIYYVNIFNKILKYNTWLTSVGWYHNTWLTWFVVSTFR